MNIELINHPDMGPENLADVDKYLSLLDKKVGISENKEAHDILFYKELAKKVREYGIDKIKDGIAKGSRVLETAGNPSYKFSTEINGELCTIFFINDPENQYDGQQRWGNFIININQVEKHFNIAKELATVYNLNRDKDIYDYISATIAHEQYHIDNELSTENEEVKGTICQLNILGEPYLCLLLDTPYSEIINRKFCTRYGIPYNPGNYGVYAKELNIVGEALRNIIANNGLENSFDNATEVVLNHLKSGYVEVDGKKKGTYVNNIQQGYYYDVDGKFKDEEYTNDIHEAFAVVVTPEILKQVMEEYKRLAEVE